MNGVTQYRRQHVDSTSASTKAVDKIDKHKYESFITKSFCTNFANFVVLSYFLQNNHQGRLLYLCTLIVRWHETDAGESSFFKLL